MNFVASCQSTFHATTTARRAPSSRRSGAPSSERLCFAIELSREVTSPFRCSMPTFRYRAYGARVEFREGSIDAVTQDAAGDMLWAQGLTPFQMRPADQSAKRWWQRELFSGHRSPASDLASFTREFATLNTAEIPLDDSLRILSEQATSPR